MIWPVMKPSVRGGQCSFTHIHCTAPAALFDSISIEPQGRLIFWGALIYNYVNSKDIELTMSPLNDVAVQKKNSASTFQGAELLQKFVVFHFW